MLARNWNLFSNYKVGKKWKKKFCSFVFLKMLYFNWAFELMMWFVTAASADFCLFNPQLMIHIDRFITQFAAQLINQKSISEKVTKERWGRLRVMMNASYVWPCFGWNSKKKLELPFKWNFLLWRVGWVRFSAFFLLALALFMIFWQISKNESLFSVLFMCLNSVFEIYENVSLHNFPSKLKQGKFTC